MPRVYDWYIDLSKNREVPIAHGIITDDARFEDATFIHTSEIKGIKVNEGTENVVITTRNTEYHCRMKDANYESFVCNELIPKYEIYKEKYSNSMEQYNVEEDSVIVALGNNKKYYFGHIIMKQNGVMHIEKVPRINIGMFQDSVSSFIGESNIRYSYFPYRQKHIEFYVWQDTIKTYIENCGNADLFVTVHGNTYKVTPSERKLITPENAEKETVDLNRQDLYGTPLIGEFESDKR